MRTPQIKIKRVWFRDGSTRTVSTWPVKKVIGDCPDFPATMLVIQISRFDRPRAVSKLHVSADVEVDGELHSMTWREWENVTMRGDAMAKLAQSNRLLKKR